MFGAPMSVTSCTHSSATHFLHPFCPHQTSLEKVSKVFMLALGAALLWLSYCTTSRRNLYEDAYRQHDEAHKKALHEKTLTSLETQGTCLASPSLFSCLDFFQGEYLHILSYETAPTIFADARLRECPQFEKFLAVPCLISGWFSDDHIVLLLLEKQPDGTYHLEFFDSKGYPIQLNSHANLLRGDLSAFFKIAHFQNNWIRYQWDRYNCGVYILWYLEQRLGGKNAQEIHGTRPDIEAYRLELAQRMRSKPPIH